jgi:hypothetical protein
MDAHRIEPKEVVSASKKLGRAEAAAPPKVKVDEGTER